MLFQIENLRKTYGLQTALDGINLELDAESVGLLGPNGAGKSTLLQVLLGLLPITSGSARVLDHDIADESLEIRRAVGYMPERSCFVPYMKAIDFVSYNGQLCGMPRKQAFRRAHEVLFFVGLEEARYRKLGEFSRGMKQRAKLAQAIVHGPRLLFLDEPTSGLDPQGRDEMLDLIEDIRHRGIRLVLSTHLLPDVERVCDSVVMLNEGRLVHAGPLDTLQEGEQQIIEIRTRLADDELRATLDDADFDVRIDDDRLKVRLRADQSPDDVLAVTVDHDIQIRHFMPEKLTLETAFLQLLDDTDDDVRTEPDDDAPVSETTEAQPA